MAVFQQRLRQFEASQQIVNAHNSDEDRTFDMEINKFSDQTADEINQLMGFVPRQSLESDQPAVLRDIEDPRHIDWVEKGCV